MRTLFNLIARSGRFFQNSPEALVLLGTGFLTRFWNIGFPPWVVFDEAHFGLYAIKYLTHEFYFDLHPPLGKMMLGFAAWIGGAVPGFDFAPLSLYPESIPYIAMRIVPAFFGSLLILLAYLFAKKLGLSRKTAFLAGSFVLLDNAILIQSRFMFLDIILLFFIACALYFFLPVLRTSEKTQNKSSLWMSGISLGLAGSIKWAGFGALAIVWIFLSVKKNRERVGYKNLLFFFLVLPLTIYTLLLPLHIALLPNVCNENCGKVLESPISADPPRLHIVENIVDQHLLMMNSTVLSKEEKLPAFSSRWYLWPLMHKGFAYSSVTQEHGKISTIFFSGNPVVWYLSLLGVIGISFLLLQGLRKKVDWNSNIAPNISYKALVFLLVSYLTFLLPFGLLQRREFLYHYLPSLFFGILLFCTLLEIILQKEQSKKARTLGYISLFILAVLTFIFFSPFSYGIPVDAGSYFSQNLWPI